MTVALSIKKYGLFSKEDENYVGGYDHAPVNIATEDEKTYQSTHFLMIFNAGEILRGSDVDPEVRDSTRGLLSILAQGLYLIDGIAQCIVYNAKLGKHYVTSTNNEYQKQ